MNKTMQWGVIIVGILFIMLSVVYFTHSAGTLPHFIPGYQAGSAHVHYKHGIGSLIVGLALFVYAWFQSGPKQQY